MMTPRERPIRGPRVRIVTQREHLCPISPTAAGRSPAADYCSWPGPPGWRPPVACSKQPAANSTPSATPSPIAPNPTTSATASPPPAPMTTAAPAATPVSRVILCRDAWGAKPPLPGGTPHTLNRMTVHHTAVVLGDNINAPARLRQHQHYHQDTQGWIDIAYHISVDRHGNIYELRSPTSLATPRQATTQLATFSWSAKETSTKKRCRRTNSTGPHSRSLGPHNNSGFPPALWKATGTKARAPLARVRASMPP